MNVKYNSEKSKKTKKIKSFNILSKPTKRNKSLHKIYNSEKENINSINIKDNIEKKENEKILVKNSDINLCFYKDLSKSFVDDFFSSINDTFTIFNSINNILYLIFASIEKSIIAYYLKNFQKICELKNAHNKYITNFRHIFDKNEKKDIIMSVSAIDNNLKLWNVSKWNCFLEIKNANEKGALFSASFLLENNNIFILTSNYNFFKKKEPIKLFNLKQEKIFEIKIDLSIIYIDCYYENDYNDIFIIINGQNKIFSYDYTNKKIYNKYGKNKCSYFSIFVQDNKKDSKLFASNFDGSIEIYEFHSGQQLNEININFKGFYGLCLWNENNLLVACCDNAIKIINLKEKKLKKCLYGHSNYVTTLKKIYIHNLGECLISQGITSDTIKLWKIDY
jgi:WD40 repeat protein